MSAIPDIGAYEFQVTALSVADGSHGHTAHGNIVEAIALTQAHILFVFDALHDHTTDGFGLGINPLVVEDSLHAHLVDGGIAIIQHRILTVADALHTNPVEGGIIITQHHILTVADALHGHTSSDTVTQTTTVIHPASARFRLDGYGNRKSYGRYYSEDEIVERDGVFLCLAHNSARWNFRDKDEQIVEISEETE